MNLIGGYVMLPRSLETTFRDLRPEETKLFISLLIQASFSNGPRTKRGEHVGSLETIARESGLTPKIVRTCLKSLEELSLISVKRANDGHRICIENYDKMQNADEYRANEGQTKGKQRATLEEVKTLRSEELTPTSLVPGGTKEQGSLRFQRPTPEEVTAYAQSLTFKLDGGQFCDFYASKGWKVGQTQMRDWKAAVRTWQRKWRETHGTDDSPRFTDYKALARANLEAKRAREKATPGPILAGVRDSPDVRSAT